MLVDIDEALLTEAATALGTATDTDTVNEALRRTVEASRDRRQHALRELRRIADAGGFDFDKIAELDE